MTTAPSTNPMPKVIPRVLAAVPQGGQLKTAGTALACGNAGTALCHQIAPVRSAPVQAARSPDMSSLLEPNLGQKQLRILLNCSFD